MRALARLLALAAPLALTTACPAGVANTVTEIDFVCPQTGGGDTLTVDVTFSTCLSSSCDTLEEASCELARDGDTITVTGEATVRSKQFGACTDDCGFVSATCSVDVEAGTYTILGGNEPVEVTTPVTESECLF